MQDFAGGLRGAAQFAVDHVTQALAVLAGGYSVGFCAWALANGPLLPGLVLENQVTSAAQASLLRDAMLGAVIALCAWLGLGVAAERSGRDADRYLRRGAAVGLGLVMLAPLPILALPDIQTGYPFLTFGLIAAFAGLAYAATSAILHAWAPAAVAEPTPKEGVASSPSGSVVGSGSPASSAWPYLLLILCLTLGYAAYMSLLTVARHNTFMTHSFDLGIHDQVIYNALHSGYLRSTQHGPDAINYLREHFSPILYLIAPLYALYQDARMLLVLQSVLLALGAIPVYLLARLKTASYPLAAALAAAYLLFPALQGINTFDFHQVVPATALLLFGLYFLEADRVVGFLLMLGLALLTKEEVALTCAGIGLYVLFAKRRFGLGALVTIVSLGYFAIVVGGIMPALGGGAQVNRFAGLMAPGSSGFGGVAKTLLTNPWYAIQSVAGNRDKLIYLCQLLLPVVGLPFAAGIAWLAALPSLGLALLSSAETQFTVGYHYPATVVPGIFFLAALGARRLDPARFRRPALAAAVLAASLAMNYEYGWILGKDFSGFPQPSRHQEKIAACLRAIPRTASLSTTSDLVPHVSNRANIYLFPVVNAADYIFFDTDPSASVWPFTGPGARSDAQQTAAGYLLSGDYGVAQAEDGCLLLQRGATTAGNEQGLRQLLSAKFEAESQAGALGQHNVPDAVASEGMARVGEPGVPHEPGNKALTYGPYDTLWPGKYRVTFWLRLAGAPVQGKLATLDVYSAAAGGELAGEDVAASALPPGNGYQPFVVDLETNRTWTDLEYRVLYEGKGQLWVDYVEVTPLRVTLPETNQVLDLKDKSGS